MIGSSSGGVLFGVLLLESGQIVDELISVEQLLAALGLLGRLWLLLGAALAH